MDLEKQKMNLYSQLIVLSVSVVFLSLIGLEKKTEPTCNLLSNPFNDYVLWDQSSFPIILNVDNNTSQEIIEEIKEAAQIWNQNLNKKVFSIQLIEPYSNFEKDKKNNIKFLSNWEKDKLSEQGRTSVYWSGEEIQEADIKINISSFQYLVKNKIFFKKTNYDSYDLKSLLIHEMGHVLGLTHNDNNHSVMKPYLSSFEERLEISKTELNNFYCGYNKNMKEYNHEIF